MIPTVFSTAGICSIVGAATSAAIAVAVAVTIIGAVPYSLLSNKCMQLQNDDEK